MNFAELSLCRVNFFENKKSTTPPFSIRSFSPSLFLEFSAATRSRVREFSREPVSSCQHPVSPRDTPIHYACTRVNCARLCVFLRRANTRAAFIHTRESTPADCCWITHAPLCKTKTSPFERASRKSARVARFPPDALSCLAFRRTFANFLPVVSSHGRNLHLYMCCRTFREKCNVLQAPRVLRK